MWWSRRRKQHEKRRPHLIISIWVYLVTFQHWYYCITFNLTAQLRWCVHMFWQLLVWRHDSPPSCDEMGGAGCAETGAFPRAALTFAVRSHLPGWKSNTVKKKKGLWQEIQRRQRYGVSNEGVPRQTGFSQTGGPENDVGRPGEIHGAAAGRLRSLRDSLVSWPGEGAHGSRQTDEERVAEFVISWFLGPFSPIIL